MTEFLDLDGLRKITKNVRLRLDGKQDKLAGLPGQIVGFGQEGVKALTIHAGENIELRQDQSGVTVSAICSNPNLLDNWYFVSPINQRGQAVYTGSGYTIDRWYSHGCTAVLSDKGLILQVGGNNAFAQHLERGLFDKLLTFSILDGRGEFISASGTLSSSAENWHQEFIYINNDVNLFFQMANGHFSAAIGLTDAAWFIRAVKLELGSVQTLAEQNAEGEWILRDPPPDGTQELLKCQRYYQVFSSPGQRPEKAADFRPVMRINPVLGTITRDGETYYTADANL